LETCVGGVCGSDECGQFTGGCGPKNDNWSCAGNWELGGLYPNNDKSITYSVTLDDLDEVFLDLNVTIDTLSIAGQAVLKVIQVGPLGDLFIVRAGGLLVLGTLYLANGRVIDVSNGQIIVGAGGTIGFLPTRGFEPDAGTIVANDMTLTAGTPCPPACPPTPGGSVELSGTMALIVNGNLVLDGTGADPCDPLGLRGALLPPPKFRATEDSSTDVFGNLDLEQSVGVFYSSSLNLQLGGNFGHHGTVPECHEWTESGMTLFGTASRTFEVAGRDVGPSWSGFANGVDTNFSLENLEVLAGATVTFVNDFANIVGTGACQEALYVRRLILRPGANVTLNNCKVYYEQLIDEGAAITTIGCGALQAVVCQAYPDCSDEDICTDDRCDGGECSHTPVPDILYGDIYRFSADAPSVVDVDDFVCMVGAFGGNFSWECPTERVDLYPCESELESLGLACTTDLYCQELFDTSCIAGRCFIVDVDDLGAVAAAFAANPYCPNPCGP
jgi:hypothetical protein